MDVDSLNARLVSIGVVAADLGVSVSWVRVLADQGVIPVARTKGGHRRFDLQAVRAVWEAQLVALPAFETPMTVVASRLYPLQGLEEHLVWKELEPLFGLEHGTAASGVAHYALTEMVNNAIDHSRGTHVAVVVSARGDDVVITVSDDGVGAYANVRDLLGLGELTDALLELSKGKRTTDPSHHSGEGVFFTSKAVEVFRLESNGISWTVDNRRDDQAVGDSRVQRGTHVRLTIARDSTRGVGDVFREFTDANHRFSRSRTSVKLAEIGTLFVSRSEARRLLVGLDAFDEVDLDFTGVCEVGQGFVDEVFRVWQRAHLSTLLTPVGMSPMVEFMVRRSMG